MKIDIQTEKPTYHQGELVKGELVITADDKGLSGDSISMILNEYWWHDNPYGGQMGWGGTKLDEVVLQQSFDFPPGTEHRFPFTLQLTRNCRITRLAENGKGYEKCGFEVELKGVKHKDRKHEFPLEVLPGREFLAIIETCEKKFKLKERKDRQKTHYNNHAFWFWLHPPINSTIGFQDMLFDLLQAENGGVKGKVTIYLERWLARGLWERFLALLRWEPDEIKPFQLTSSQLFLPDGTANQAAIEKAIEEVIGSVMATRRKRAF